GEGLVELDVARFVGDAQLDVHRFDDELTADGRNGVGRQAAATGVVGVNAVVAGNDPRGAVAVDRSQGAAGDVLGGRLVDAGPVPEVGPAGADQAVLRALVARDDQVVPALLLRHEVADRAVELAPRLALGQDLARGIFQLHLNVAVESGDNDRGALAGDEPER